MISGQIIIGLSDVRRPHVTRRTHQPQIYFMILIVQEKKYLSLILEYPIKQQKQNH